MSTLQTFAPSFLRPQAALIKQTSRVRTISSQEKVCLVWFLLDNQYAYVYTYVCIMYVLLTTSILCTNTYHAQLCRYNTYFGILVLLCFWSVCSISCHILSPSLNSSRFFLHYSPTLAIKSSSNNAHIFFGEILPFTAVSEVQTLTWQLLAFQRPPTCRFCCSQKQKCVFFRLISEKKKSQFLEITVVKYRQIIGLSLLF